MALYGFRADGSPLKTQWETVLYHLQSTGEKITSWKAIKDFGFTRLSAVVKAIEEHTGIVLPRQSVKIKTRYGGTVYVTEYWYEEPKEQGDEAE